MAGNQASGTAGWITRPSPNFGERRTGGRPAMVVLHYTGMHGGEAAVDRLCDPAAQVSAHYLVDTDGAVVAMVAEPMRAWHAGGGGWGAMRDVNSWSIGIEIANPGHRLGYPPFPEPQMAALERLLGVVMERWSIPPERVIGHACMAPGRKFDPGEKLDWRRLARRGLAVWLDPPGARSESPADPARFSRAAQAFGYPVTPATAWDEGLKAVWHSFAMRFLAGSPLFDAPPCAAGEDHLAALAERWPVAPFVAG